MKKATYPRRDRGALLHFIGLLGAAALVPPIAAACSDSGDDGAAATTASTSGTGGGGGSSSGMGGDVFASSSGSGGGGGLGGACATDSFEGELVPLDIYIMFDRSYSMNDPADGTSTRWEAVTSALKAFVASSPADTSVGLQYFPLFASEPVPCATDTDCGACIGCCLQGSGGGHCLPPPPYDCTSGAYATPDVAIGSLPANETALVASLDAHYPFAGTPTAPALQGAIDHAAAWAAANPTHRTVVVLATDGIPQDCSPTDIPSIAAIAQTGAQATPAVNTFVVGVGDAQGLENLDAIASAGGTQQAFVVTDANASAEFAAAMEVIRKSLACEFLVPTPTTGEPDFEKINVAYTPGGGSAEIVGQVPNAEGCTADGGWYYDDPANPTTILLCPATCDVAKADPTGKIDVLLGCKTVIAEPA